VLHELGAGARLSADDADKRTLPPPAAACSAESRLLVSYSAVSRTVDRSEPLYHPGRCKLACAGNVAGYADSVAFGFLLKLSIVCPSQRWFSSVHCIHGSFELLTMWLLPPVVHYHN
jgi:hypothetical protein